MRVTVHCGSSYSAEHNRRDPHHTARDGHIDQTRTHMNHAWWEHDLPTAYARIFGEAVAEYNAKQTRPERKIKNLLSATQADKQRHPAYEMIAQVGSVEDGLEPMEAATVLLTYLEGWRRRNSPYLRVVGAYLHMDEATPHLHVDFVPVAEYEHGLRLRPGLNRAMEQLMGCKSQGRTHTAQIAWQEREREILREICRQRGHAVEEGRHGLQARHVSTPAYRARQQQTLIEQGRALQAQQEQLRQERAALQAREAALRQADPTAYRRYERRLEAADRGWEVEELEADDL